MVKFKFDNCTSKQFVRQEMWVPEASARRKRLISVKKSKEARRLRYLTFCAEGAIDVRILERAKVIRRSSEDNLFDTVVFFALEQDSVDRTLEIIEGATGFPVDFFQIMDFEASDLPDDEDIEDMARENEEDIETFKAIRNSGLKLDFRATFPFDLINLDVERYVLQPREELPGKLLAAWDKILEWQKRKGNLDGKVYRTDEFTLFFTTKVGPFNLPEGHRKSFIDLLNKNLKDSDNIKKAFMERFTVADGDALYENNFPEFLKVAVPKALISRALRKDWLLDETMSFRCIEFDREANSHNYTMMHYCLHFRRCIPSLTEQVDPSIIPDEIRLKYEESIRTVFTTNVEDADELKLPLDTQLKDQLKGLGIEELS